MAFIGRENELETLEKAYGTVKTQFYIVYGRRRVGKTALIKEFFKDKPHIYFLADKASETDQLKMLAKRTADYFNDRFVESRGFGNWYDFFEYIKERAKGLVLVFDEFPYLVEANRAISSIFQKGFDEYLAESGIFLILSGSSIGMMETEVLGYKAPLYGRRTGQIKLEPFHFTYLSRFFPDLNVEALLYIYSITGGVPAYFLQIDPAVSFYDNIKKHLLDQSAYLAREPEFILREEFKEPRTYFSILRAIALGRHRHGEIINETGLEKNVLMKYLSVLQSLGIVSRNVPITEKIPEKCKMGLYVISDLLMKFWFANIYLNRDYIEEGHGEELIEEKIKPSMERYVSHAFEHICRDYFKRWLRISGKYAGFDRVGRWWDRNEEIDVVALNWQKNSSIFGEVKWSKNPVGTDILNNLRQKSLHVRWGGTTRHTEFALFSKSGFTREVEKSGKSGEVMLFSIKDFEEILLNK